LDFFEIMDKGGILMYPILSCSVISLLILMERLVSLRKSRIISGYELVLHLSQQGDWTELSKEVKKRDDYLSVILDLVLQDDTSEDPVKVTEMYAKKVSSNIYRWISVPGVMATISPLLGLLGTTLGMIKIFNRFTEAGGNPMILAGGIWEALITTAAGLTVAIPSLIIYRYLSYRADHAVEDIEFALEKVLMYRTKTDS